MGKLCLSKAHPVKRTLLVFNTTTAAANHVQVQVANGYFSFTRLTSGDFELAK